MMMMMTTTTTEYNKTTTTHAQICACKGNDRLKNIDYSCFQY